MSDVDSSSFQKPLLQRSFSRVERDTIQKVLDAVEEEARKREKQGLSTQNFFLGVSNCLFVAYTFGAMPESFWLVYIFEVLVLFPVRYSNQAAARPLKQTFYWLDLCWIANFYGVIAMATLAVCEFWTNITVTDESRFIVFSSAWGLGCGALLLAAGLLGNALIFHDADNVASVLIHLFPSLVLYTFRWKGDVVHETWPLFHFNYFANITCLDIAYWSVSWYLMWAVLYTLWLICHGLRLPKKGYDTIFHYNMRSHLGCLIYTKIRCLKKEDHKNAASENEFLVKDVLIYMFFHALVTCIALVTSLLAYQSQPWHAVMNLSMTAMVIWNGASRYDYYMIRLWRKKVNSLMAGETTQTTSTFS